MRLLYVKPELRDLSQGSRVAFVRQLRHMSQDDVSDYLGLTGECKRRSMTRYEKGDKRYIEQYIIKTIIEYNKLNVKGEDNIIIQDMIF